jgi:hypothetical protein
MNPLARQNRVDWFHKLAQRVGITQDPRFSLLAEIPIDKNNYQEIKRATVRFILSCLGNSADFASEQALLEAAATRLANRTPNGILLPKQESQREFNQLHRVVASWLRSLSVDDLIYEIFCPLTVRLVKGQRSVQEESRPYASTKLHADLWAGEPADFVDVHIPLMGDIERTTIEFYQPPADFEEKFLRILNDYDEGRELESRSERYPTNMRLQHAYFVDAIVLHRTMKKQGTDRLTIQLELRRSTTDAEKRRLETLCDPGRLSHYVPRDEWYNYGTSKYLRFKDTYADAVKGNFTKRPYDERIYDVVDSL